MMKVIHNLISVLKMKYKTGQRAGPGSAINNECEKLRRRVGGWEGGDKSREQRRRVLENG